ncbi:MAG: D-alanine--D-alanine ligase [Firmicutes bacterium]|nr:D-alanine--D-alanine ligase [Bacillota bacterium]
MFNAGDGFYSQNVKSQGAVQTQCPANIQPELLARIEHVVLGAFNALECRDYARIDIRVDRSGTPYVIDVNTLPGLEPGYSDYPKAAQVAGLSFRHG